MGSGLKGLLAASATVVLVWFGTGLHPVWPLVWIAPLPVLLYALSANSSAWGAAVVAWAGWLAGCGNFFGYFRLLGIPTVAWFTAFGLAAVIFTAGVLLCRGLVRHGATWSAVMALPAIWVTFEYLRNLLWPHGSSGSLAYSQLKFLPFLQMASLTGPWGMSFVLLFLPSGLAVAWSVRKRNTGQALRVAATTACVMVVVLVFGAVRLETPQHGPITQVGLVTSDARGHVSTARAGEATQRLMAEYATAARGLIERGAKVVVMPEKLGTIGPDTIATDTALQQLVDATDATLVAGFVRIEGPLQYNEARVYLRGLAVRTYDKEHMLPPFENVFTPGKSLLVLHRPEALWGVAVCKDMDFMNPARSNGRMGVGLMLVPGWDFDVDGFWHGHIAVMRGVEDGFSVARAAKDGLLTVTDDRGRVVAERASNASPFVTLLTNVPTGHDGTLYLLWGDWFAWCAMLLCGWALGRRWIGFAAESRAEMPAEKRSLIGQ